MKVVAIVGMMVMMRGVMMMIMVRGVFLFVLQSQQPPMSVR